jgi:hypothetical protein
MIKTPDGGLRKISLKRFVRENLRREERVTRDVLRVHRTCKDVMKIYLFYFKNI